MMKKETYVTPSIEQIEVGSIDVILISSIGDNDIDATKNEIF